jgi:hypothetical protein
VNSVGSATEVKLDNQNLKKICGGITSFHFLHSIIPESFCPFLAATLFLHHLNTKYKEAEKMCASILY